MPSQPLLCNVCSLTYDVYSWSGSTRVAVVPTDCTVTTEKVVKIIPDCQRLEELSTKYIHAIKLSVQETSVCCLLPFLPAGHALHMQPAGAKIALWFLHLYLCVSALITCARITSRKLLPCDLLITRLRQFRRLLCVATKGSLARLGVWHGYWEAEATQTWLHEAAEIPEASNYSRYLPYYGE